MTDSVADRSNELTLWSGSPDSDAVFTTWDFFWVPFSLVWTGFAIHFLIVAPLGFPTLVGLVMVVVGMYLIAGRFFAKIYLKRRMANRLTGEEAVISGPRRTFTLDLTVGDAEVHVQQRRRSRSWVTFSSSSPRLSGWSFFRAGFADTGLDIPLVPGLDIAFTFYDVRADPELSLALETLTSRPTTRRHGAS